MRVTTVVCGPLQVNCHLLADEQSGEAGLVDPGDDGDALLDAVEQAGLRLTAVWLTHAHFDHVGGLAAVRHGGRDMKSEPVENIIEAIRAARVGESYLTPELEVALAEEGAVPKLSAQERRVMALYGAGQPVKAVAFQLGISEETAKSYLKRIREKYRAAGFDVGTKVALRKRAILDGILLQSD